MTKFYHGEFFESYLLNPLCHKLLLRTHTRKKVRQERHGTTFDLRHPTHGDTDQRYLCVFYTHSGLVPRSVPLSFDVPVVVGLGEGDDQKIPVLQVF